MTNKIMTVQAQNEHLLKVSRTFALTIPMLPSPIDDYISNAYLLCRIADTVEDDPKADVLKKIEWLCAFSKLALNKFDDESLCVRLRDEALSLCHDGAKDSEYELLEQMVQAVLRCKSFDSRTLSVISRGVAIMSEGMAKSLKGVKVSSLDDVDAYCYYVAGVVGEFLAALFSLHCHEADANRLMDLSVSFGEGLQLTNILKDRFTDAQRGVSFLPKTSSKEEDTAQFYEYQAITQGHLEDALDFILTLPASEKGIRQFCLLNICMAAATLRLMARTQMSGSALLKISRNKVKILYVLTRICSGSDFCSKLLFKFCSSKNKSTRRDAAALRARVSCWSEHD